MSAPAPRPAVFADDTGAQRLLLVEDNPADALMVREMLRSALTADFEFTHSPRLDDACTRLAQEGAACVLLDLTLPDADGLEALTRIQAAAPDLPIVVLSGRDDEEMALNAVKLGAQDYLIKGRVDDRLIARSIRYAIERKRVEVQLAHQALHDPLTGLPNRALFADRLELALARAQRRASAVAVLFLDLDGFKVINDSLGHAAGDRLLVEVARRLTAVLRPGDTVARFGGDEFTILCDDIEGVHDAVVIAERVGAAVAAPFVLDDTEELLTASVGIAMSAGSDAPPEGLVRDADIAMYRAKERGKSRYELFDGVMRARAVERMQTENALRRAIERDELRVHYQPLLELPARRVVGVEALVRWQHPERGLLLPGQFLDLAEESGQIVELGQWVLRHACSQHRDWCATVVPDGEPLRLFVNLSGRQLARADLVAEVTSALEEARMDPSQLCLEITESVVVEDTEAATVALEALKAAGTLIAIDDFGTDHASLMVLKRVPADLVKVDRSLVAGMGGDPQDTAIAQAVIDLAEGLGMEAVAEGVERPEQVSALESAGCRFAQGFHFARPLPAQAVTDLLAAGRRL